MATPGRETRQSALNFEDGLYGEGRPRQRIRRLLGESKDDSNAWELTDDGRPKTRRVNPQRLALRLGPELVAEMEAYIVPGAKMPPFSIRKDFQERYCVDRRHIYDYFHSRGLRVAKEDKHTNLIRGRAMKAKVLSQTLLISQSPSETPSGAMDGLAVDKTYSRITPKSRIHTTKRTTKRKSAVVRRSVKKSRGVSDGLPGEVSSESGGETSVSGTDNGGTTSPQFTLACDSSDESIATSAASEFLPSPSSFLPGFFGAPDHLPQTFPDIEGFPGDEKHISVDQDCLLTQGERTELYDLISGSMPGSVPVEAPQSSHNLLSVDNINRGGRLYHYETPGRSHLACGTSLDAFEPSHCDSNDLKTWLFDDLDLHQSTLDIFLPSRLDGYLGFYEVPIFSGDYPQAAILSSQNRLPSSKAPNSVACAKQHIVGHAKKDAENMDPGTYFNSR